MWAYSRDVCEQHKNKDLIYWGANLNAKRTVQEIPKRRKKSRAENIWPYADVTQAATQELQIILKDVGGSFHTPSALIMRIVQLSGTR